MKLLEQHYHIPLSVGVEDSGGRVYIPLYTTVNQRFFPLSSEIFRMTENA